MKEIKYTRPTDTPVNPPYGMYVVIDGTLVQVGGVGGMVSFSWGNLTGSISAQTDLMATFPQVGSSGELNTGKELNLSTVSRSVTTLNSTNYMIACYKANSSGVATGDLFYLKPNGDFRFNGSVSGSNVFEWKPDSEGLLIRSENSANNGITIGKYSGVVYSGNNNEVLTGGRCSANDFAVTAVSSVNKMGINTATWKVKDIQAGNAYLTVTNTNGVVTLTPVESQPTTWTSIGDSIYPESIGTNHLIMKYGNEILSGDPALGMFNYSGDTYSSSNRYQSCGMYSYNAGGYIASAMYSYYFNTNTHNLVNRRMDSHKLGTSDNQVTSWADFNSNYFGLVSNKITPKNFSYQPTSSWEVTTSYGYVKARRQGNVVTLTIKDTRNGSSSKQTIISNLPADYRPEQEIKVPVNWYIGSGQAAPFTEICFMVATNGEIYIPQDASINKCAQWQTTAPVTCTYILPDSAPASHVIDSTMQLWFSGSIGNVSTTWMEKVINLPYVVSSTEDYEVVLTSMGERIAAGIISKSTSNFTFSGISSYSAATQGPKYAVYIKRTGNYLFKAPNVIEAQCTWVANNTGTSHVCNVVPMDDVPVGSSFNLVQDVSAYAESSRQGLNSTSCAWGTVAAGTSCASGFDLYFCVGITTTTALTKGSTYTFTIVMGGSTSGTIGTKPVIFHFVPPAPLRQVTQDLEPIYEKIYDITTQCTVSGTVVSVPASAVFPTGTTYRWREIKAKLHGATNSHPVYAHCHFIVSAAGSYSTLGSLSDSVNVSCSVSGTNLNITSTNGNASLVRVFMIGELY